MNRPSQRWRRTQWAWPVLQALFLLFLLFARPVGAQPRPISPDNYWNLVTETEALLRQAAALPEEKRPALLQPLARRWAGVAAVSLPGGGRIAITTGPLVTQLQQTPPDVVALQHRLAALAAMRDRWPAPAYSAGAAPQAQAQLEEILAQPEFQWQSEQPSLLQRLWQRILRAVFNLLPETAARVPLLNYLLTGLGLAVLGAVILYALYRLRRGFAAESATDGGDAADDAPLTADRALQRAQTLSHGGDYRSAVRYLYLSTLLLLDERGLLRYDRSRTNREVLRSVAHHPDLAATLREAAYAHYEAQVNTLRRR
jgi:hypothetical protein